MGLLGTAGRMWGGGEMERGAGRRRGHTGPSRAQRRLHTGDGEPIVRRVGDFPKRVVAAWGALTGLRRLEDQELAEA